MGLGKLFTKEDMNILGPLTPSAILIPFRFQKLKLLIKKFPRLSTYKCKDYIRAMSPESGHFTSTKNRTKKKKLNWSIKI